MAKQIEVRLHSLTCEFAGDDGEVLAFTGNLRVESFDDPAVIKTTNVIFDFPDGPIRLHKGQSILIDRAVRVAMAVPIDPPGLGELFVKFGGELVSMDESPSTIFGLGSQWGTVHTSFIASNVPWPWRFYFGKNRQIVRSDFSVVFVHPL